MTTNTGTPHTPPYTVDANTENNGNRRNRGNNRNRSNNNAQIQLSNPVTYEGDIPEVNCVLGLKHEKFNKKAPSYEVFLEKIGNYAVSNLKNGGDVRSLMTKMVDPIAIFNKKRRPTELSAGDAAKPMEIKIQDK